MKSNSLEQHFRRALALDITDGFLLAAYADFSLDYGRPQEVIALLKNWIAADPLLLRLALAEQAVNAKDARAHQATLADRYAAARLRGDTTHEQEEPRFSLQLLQRPEDALRLAQRNWLVQREPRDARVLLDAALALRRPQAAQPVLDWMTRSPQHKGLLRLVYQGTTRTAIFGPEAARQRFDLARPSRYAQFVDYGREGVWHIWIGFDHILFLLALWLPAVLVPLNRGWRPAQRFQPTFWDVFKIVTAFTVAHSITLSLAALGVLSLPTRLTESAIAMSVMLAALNNIFPLFQRRRWMVAFAFGLIHGFGFASVLADLGLPRDALLLALVGFNLGVEVGQLAIVSVFLPVAYWLRETNLYRRGIFYGGSALVCVLAGVWFCERAFNFKLLPF